MRISGGAARGIVLQVPKGDVVRPATDGMRQAVFSSLGARVDGARFVDLFAGSGAYGLEAASRGASAGVFVEKNPKAQACIRANIATVCKSIGRPPDAFQLAARDVLTWSPAPAEVPDIVFIDPPYHLIGEIGETLFRRLTEALAAASDPLIVFEMPGEITLEPAGWTAVKRLGKGARQPTVVVFRRT